MRRKVFVGVSDGCLSFYNSYPPQNTCFILLNIQKLNNRQRPSVDISSKALNIKRGVVSDVDVDGKGGTDVVYIRSGQE